MSNKNSKWAWQLSHPLVETSWLAQHLDDPDVRIVDVRGSIRTVEQNGVQETTYLGAHDEYKQGHIPGALYIDWVSDITDPDDEVEAQVAPAARFAEKMSSLGIGDQHLVVAYDAHATSQFATRLWWALNYYGHSYVVVLNGGLIKWKRENRPLVNTTPSYSAESFTPVVQPDLRATAEDVYALIGRSDVKLIDARDPKQFTGAVIRNSSRGGHIPGALNIAHKQLLDPEACTFRSKEELSRIFSTAGISPDQHIVAYCNGGIAATTILFSLNMLGYTKLTNYDGSWNEWGKRQDLPVVK